MNSNKGKQKFSVIYQITNLLDGRIYIGAHMTYNINDEYMGSSKYLKKDIKKFGRENFRKDILFECLNKEEMMKKENELVNREFCNRPDTYNLMIGGSYNFSDMVTVKDKEGNTSKVYLDNPRYLSGELVGIQKGIPGACGMLNKKHTQASKDKMSNSQQNKIVSIETCNKISKSNTGRVMSKEWKDNISKAAFNRPPRTFLYKQIACSNGIIYENIKQAAKELNIPSASSISAVCKNKKKHAHGYKFSYI